MHVPNTPPFRAPGGPIVLSAAVASPANSARAIAFLSQTGEAFRIPLFEAVARDEIALCHLWPDQAPPLSKLDRTGRPALLVLNDDNDTTRLGPAGWSRAGRILRWGGATIVHGTGGKREHYVLAVTAAIAARRLVVVETSSWRVDAWTEKAMRFMPPGRILQITPFVGEFHPIMPEPGTVQ